MGFESSLERPVMRHSADMPAGTGPGGDSTPWMIAFQLRLEF